MDAGPSPDAEPYADFSKTLLDTNGFAAHPRQRRPFPLHILHRRFSIRLRRVRLHRRRTSSLRRRLLLHRSATLVYVVDLATHATVGSGR